MDYNSIKEAASNIEYVDLGLSVKWGTCNLGATTPQETGYRFTYDEKKQIDFATVPTKEQCEELVNDCEWTWKSGDKPGVTITGKNGNSIFLPACGELNTDGLMEDRKAGSYWANTNMRGSNNTWSYYFSFINKFSWITRKTKINKGVYSTHNNIRTLVIRPVQ